MNESVIAIATIFCLLVAGCETPPKEPIPGVDYEVPTRSMEPIDQGFAGDMTTVMKCHMRTRPDVKSKTVAIVAKGQEFLVLDGEDHPRWYAHYRKGELVYMAKSCFGVK